MFFLNRSLLIALVLLFSLTGCMTKVTNTWKKDNYSGKKFASILIVGVSRDENNKVLWENIMADNLRQNGVNNVIISASGFPGIAQLNREDIVRYVTKNNIEGVLVTRLVDITKESVYYPPTGSFYSGGQYSYYSSFPSYYRHAYEVDYAAGQRADRTIVLLETTLYKSDTQELIWSMSSETFNPNSANQLAKEVGRKIIQRLKKDRLI